MSNGYLLEPYPLKLAGQIWMSVISRRRYTRTVCLNTFPPGLVWWLLGHVFYGIRSRPFPQLRHDPNTHLLSNMGGLGQKPAVPDFQIGTSTLSQSGRSHYHHRAILRWILKHFVKVKTLGLFYSWLMFGKLPKWLYWLLCDGYTRDMLTNTTKSMNVR